MNIYSELREAIDETCPTKRKDKFMRLCNSTLRNSGLLSEKYISTRMENISAAYHTKIDNENAEDITFRTTKMINLYIEIKNSINRMEIKNLVRIMISGTEDHN